MNRNKDYMNVLILIKNNIPMSKIITLFMLIIKLIPLILITHDWNSNYPIGLSYYIKQLTLIDLVHDFKMNAMSKIMVLLLFIVSFISLVIFLMLLNQIKSFGSLINKTLFKIVCILSYWINFFFNQHIFMLVAHNYFCRGISDPYLPYELIIENKDDCRDIYNIIVCIIQSFLIIFCLIVSYIICFIISDPFSSTQGLITIPLKGLNIEMIIFPMIQGIIGIALHVSFSVSVIITAIIRGIYVIYYLRYIYKEPKMFFSNELITKIINITYSMCFISCLMEYAFLFDWNRHLIYLQENWNIVFFKLLLELTIAIVILLIKNYYEEKNIIEIFDNQSICNDMPYELFNKIFYIISRVELVIYDDLLYKIIEAFCHYFPDHKLHNKCQKKIGLNCYCVKYTEEKLIKQSDDFLTKINDIRQNSLLCQKKLLKTTFPLLYKYIEYFLKSQVIKQKGKKQSSSLILALALFYNIFDNNYNKSLFYLEEFINTDYYKESIIIQFQTKLIHAQLCKDYTNNLITEPEFKANYQGKPIPTANSFLSIYQVHNALLKQIQIENQLTKAICLFNNTLDFFNENQCNFSAFLSRLKILSETLSQIHESLSYHLNNSLNSNYHLCSKLTLFYSFFFNEIPSQVKSCFRNIFEYDCRDEKYSKLLINVYNSKDNWQFSIQYASDDLCNRLGYKLSDLKSNSIEVLFPSSLKKCFEYMILRRIKMGSVQFQMKEIIILDKDNYSSLYDMIGIVIFTEDGLKLFLKTFAHNYKAHKLKPKQNKSKKPQKIKSNNKNDKSNIKKSKIGNECFVIVNNIGKIIGISKEFEKYFSLNLSAIKKYKINLFKDILKVENMTFNLKEVIKREILHLYDIIAELNFNFMQNSTNEEFSKIYKNIKEIQKRIISKKKTIQVICTLEHKELLKTEHEIKGYYYITFELEINQQCITTFNNYLNNDITSFPIGGHKKAITFQKSSFKSINNLSPSLISLNPPIISQPKFNSFQINKNSYDVQVKLSQIQILSLKYLTHQYNIKTKDILDLTPNEEIEFNTLTNELEIESLSSISNSVIPSNSTIQNINVSTIQGISNSGTNLLRHFKPKNKDSYELLQRESSYHKTRRKIYIQLIIWIFFSILFIGIHSSIIILDNSSESQLNNMRDILSLSLFTRHIFYSIISSLLRIQNCENGIQNDRIIDNGFNNSKEYHKEMLVHRTQDFLNYYKEFQMKENILYFYQKLQYIHIFEQLQKDISVINNVTLDKYTLNDFLSMLHLSLDSFSNSSQPIIFNTTSPKTYDYSIKAHVSQLIFIIENTFFPVKYVWDEGDNWLIADIKKSSVSITNHLYIINFSNGFILFVVFLLQSYFYNKLNNQIFSKYYINYNYIQFFSSLLTKKVVMMKEFIDNSAFENYERFHQCKLIFSDKSEDNQIFKDNYSRISFELPLVIKPYKIKEIILDNQCQLNLKDDGFSFLDSSIGATNIFEHSQLKSIIKEKELSIIPKSIAEPYKTLNNRRMSMSPYSILNKRLHAKRSSKGNALNSIIPPTNQIPETEKYKTDIKLNNKNQLKKPKSFIRNIIIYAMISLSIIIFCTIHGVIINTNISLLNDFTVLMKAVLDENIKTQEIGLIYNIILLKNQKMEYFYTSHGYLSFLPENEYLNNLINHDILNDTIANFNLYQTIIPQLQQKMKLSILNDFISKIDSPDSCNYYVDFYIDNQKSFPLNILSVYANITERKEEYKKECNMIGLGINSKGISTAKRSFVSDINNSYGDFTNDSIKTSQSMIQRINNNMYQSFQVEIDLVLDKLFAVYYIALYQGYFKTDNILNDFCSYFLIVILGLVIAIDIIYIWKFTYRFIIENKIINDIENSLYHSIMF